MYINFNQKIREVKEFSSEIAQFYFEYPDNGILFDVKTSLGEFKKINFFVGTNNSGKSRFLRGLLKVDNRNILLRKDKEVLINYIKLFYEKNFQKNLNDILDELEKRGYKPNLSYWEQIESFVRKLILIWENENYKDIYENYKEDFDNIRKLQDELYRLKYQFDLDEWRITQNVLDGCNLLMKIENIIKTTELLQTTDKFYIPILRSLTKNDNLRDDTFEAILKVNYAINSGAFTGLNLHDSIREKKASKKDIRSEVREFEKFLAKNFFENKEVEITSTMGNEKAILFSVDNEEFPIYDLGDGIQMLILLLFPIFTAKKNTWVFIEEPEMNLHPGLQRVFIEALLNDEYLKSKSLRYFFTTHSNHFLDLSIEHDEIAIFQFEKLEPGKFFIKNNIKPNKDTLNLLGVNTSSVFLANTSIWIEGPTDRRYMSRYLKMYCEEEKLSYLKEDIDYAFFEYGGNLIEHYLFDDKFEEDYSDGEVREKIKSFALSNKIYLMADNDNVKDGSAKASRRDKLEKLQADHFKYQNTQVVEIENLLPVFILKDFLKTLVKKDSEKVGTIEFEKANYKKERLGEFFYELLINNGFLEKDIYKFKAPSGTLKNEYKIKLCDFVTNRNDFTFNDFVEENEILKEIVLGLYQFIKQK
ncbi:AAA family ATPase [Flavobacterium sp. CAU 1735]|uniref:AAA family ATPase n=1 Tax=Flavobacterium sp. CAU 1735 TaxID=3140361 RepID=UPI00326065B3